MKIGSIIQWTSNTIPDGFLLCDGSAVSRTTYAELFSVIGTTYGAGDSTTTFNLPDLRGRVGVGKSSDTEFDTLGEIGGEKKHTLTVDEMPSHQHKLSLDEYGQDNASAVKWASGNNKGKYAYSGDMIEPVGGGQAHNILQPYLVTNYIIKALNPDSIKISELDSVSSITSSDVLPIVQSGDTKKVTTAKLLEGVTTGLNSIYNSETYSTNEVETIGKWIDGKSIYRKVINLGIFPDNTYKDVATGLSNINIIKIYGTAKNENTGNTIPLPHSSTSTVYSVSIAWQESENSVRVTTGMDRTDYTGYAVLEYTKN